jgi:hypothetical protein
MSDNRDGGEREFEIPATSRKRYTVKIVNLKDKNYNVKMEEKPLHKITEGVRFEHPTAEHKPHYHVAQGRLTKLYKTVEKIKPSEVKELVSKKDKDGRTALYTAA